MERRGALVSWNDDKGFGFIQPEPQGERLFVHISAMRGDTRPVVGMPVFFVAGQDERGRPRATHMRGEGLSLDRPAIRRKPKSAPQTPRKPVKTRVSAAPRKAARRPSRPAGPIRHVPIKLLVLAVLCAMPVLGAVTLLREQATPWPLAAYLLVSIVSFIQYAMDKHSAEIGRWRTPENTLHITELLGGWPGALVAQQVFRHKTRKASFQTAFWLIVLVHQIFWLDYLLLGGAWLSKLIA